MEEALGRSPAPGFAGQLADERHVAEVALGGGAGLLGGYPGRHQLLGLVGEMHPVLQVPDVVFPLALQPKPLSPTVPVDSQ